MITPFTLAGFYNVNRRLSLDDNPRDVTANSWGLVYHHRALQFWMGTRSDSEHFIFHDQVFVLAHKDGDVEHRWLPGMCWSSRLLSVCEILLSSASVCCAGGREKHPGAGAVSVQPPHPVRELLLCDAQRRGHISHGSSVCHRVAELRGAGAAVHLFRALPDHPAVGLLLWPQVTLKGQSEECIIISCGRAQLFPVKTTAGLWIISPTLIKSHLFNQRKMTLLEDNHAGALYNYLISVQTGHRKNAGTTANVSLFLFSSCATIASIFCQPGDSGENTIWRLMDPLLVSCRSPWSWVAQRERATFIHSQIPTSVSLREEPLTCSCWPPPSHWATCKTSGCSTITLEVPHHGRTHTHTRTHT